MSINRRLAAGLWVLAGAAAFALGTAWAGDHHKITPWALVAFFWSAALLSVLIHYLAQGPHALRRYLLRRKPVAALPAGAGAEAA